jgi:hypothetical protein
MFRPDERDNRQEHASLQSTAHTESEWDRIACHRLKRMSSIIINAAATGSDRKGSSMMATT